MGLNCVIGWLLIGAASFPIWGAVLIELWQGLVRPHMIRRAEIERLAADMIERYGQRAGQASFTSEHRAWCDGETFEQAMWRRVRKAIERRQGARLEHP